MARPHLAQIIGGRKGYAYISFDDAVLCTAAQADPVGFAGDLPERVILDEVQRVPALFSALKVAVDRKRSAGRYILTGSANVLLVPKLADSLAGRMENHPADIRWHSANSIVGQHVFSTVFLLVILKQKTNGPIG